MQMMPATQNPNTPCWDALDVLRGLTLKL